ncbi:3 beta-hydroxysteroid dehydrogenase/delta 5--_4-isomerase [mine drainage metagenome]|uniref:3 beta-hydroxysteroid dehydrogenase/delta 5-->4-isomerase n=1 Tax=mine drainage metagenome TaxID=410659 RepID=A0A1J5TDY8_9ZZZZ
MQVSITGATGLIGRRLVRYYEENGATVHILSREVQENLGKNTKCFQYDLRSCSADDLADFVAGSDVVFHCAAELHDSSTMYSLNVQGTQKLYEAASNAKVHRWVQLSSVGIYGRPRVGMISESYAPDPQNDYEKSKLEADEWLLAQSRQGKVELVILRPSTVFANDMPNQSLFQLFRAIQSGKFFYIGTKQAQMNYVHADDVLTALVLCGQHEDAAGETFIVSENISMADFMDIVASQLRCRQPSLVIPEWTVRVLAGLFGWMPCFPLTASRIDALTNRCIFLDSHIRERLGYRPSLSLRQGLVQFSGKFTGGE